MHYCKVKSTLLGHCTSWIRTSRRCFSMPATSENKSFERSKQTLNISVLNKNKSVDTDIEYPPILDLSRPAKKRREREVWHNKIKKLSTVEEKIFELNMPRYYGWTPYKIEEGVIPYDALPHAQYLTKTHFVSEPGLPSYYDAIIHQQALDTLVQKIKTQVEEILIFEYSTKKQNYQNSIIELENKICKENTISKAISQQVNRVLISNLVSNYQHLIETQIDIDPRIEAFWFFGGCEAPKELIRSRSGQSWTEEFRDEPINQCFRYLGKPMLQLRHKLPLKEIISLDDSTSSKLEIPMESLDPRKYEYFKERSRARVIPGFWPGDFSEFGFISFHNRSYLLKRPVEFNDELDAIKTQAVFASFSWLYGLACYQGFSNFQDPTYPLVNQMIITNGQWWSFCVYQLNTTEIHIDRLYENPRKNICWMTDPIKLFDGIENETIQGFNEDVLKYLIKFYANFPQVKEDIEMKPYLGNESVIAGIEDPERRKWVEERYKYLMSNRERHRLIPEIYHWQKIYMIDHKTRPLDKKRDVWQFNKNIWKRRLDDHTPEYIPKCKRSHPKSKDKWAKCYYPSVPEDEASL